MNQSIKKAFLDTKDAQIFYQIAGEGKALLLLHRSPRSSDEFRTMMPILARARQVIAMDLMGYGDSDLPPRDYSMADYAQRAIDLLDELDIKTTSILGNHTGAYLAAEIAAAYRDRVEKLILCNVDRFSEENKSLILKFYESFQLQSDPNHLVEKWSYLQSIAGSLELTNRCFLDMVKCFGHPPYGAAAVVNYVDNLEERFSLIKCPTLVMSGTEDIKELEKLGMATAAERDFIFKIIPQAEKVDIDGGTICMMSQMPEQISKIVVDFLDRT